MPEARRLRIAMLAHSTNPRGGVVHALALAEALHDAGHEVAVHAPDPAGRGFFRPTRCAIVSVAAGAAPSDLAAMVAQRVGEYVAHFERAGCADWDLFHAQDSISANALATLAERGRIKGFVRTVHHLDRFDDPAVMAWQRRGIERATRLYCVSRQWQRLLASEHGLRAECVPNGVDRDRYTPRPDARDAALRTRLGLDGAAGPVLLAVGGVEARKNTRRILEAFLRLRATHPDARLVIAGGASLLDHGAYRAGFDALLAAQAWPTGPAAPVQITGPLADTDMPALYRLADALVFPSLKEGFGLVVLEALASGVPAAVSRIEPFTEHLPEAAVAWCEPEDSASIAAATVRALDPAARAAMLAAAPPLLARYGWAASARRHLELYRELTHPLPETADA